MPECRPGTQIKNGDVQHGQHLIQTNKKALLVIVFFKYDNLLQK
jgi:hypothetical protein